MGSLALPCGEPRGVYLLLGLTVTGNDLRSEGKSQRLVRVCFVRDRHLLAPSLS